MTPDSQILNYLFWLRQRGQALPYPRRHTAQAHPILQPFRFLALTDREAASWSESQRTVVDRMLSATGLPRASFRFETTTSVLATIADAKIEGIICMGASALQAISPHPFESALTALLPLASQGTTLICCIHTPEDMERDPQLKRITWSQLQRFVAAVKEEPQA